MAQDGQIRDLGLPEGTLNDYYNESTEMLLGWLKRNLPSLQNRNLRPQAEVKLFSQSHRVMGVIDAIHSLDGKVSLTDYKTGKIDTLSQDIKVQMSIYALLYRENFGVLPDQIILDFLKFQQAKPFPVTDAFVQYAARLCSKIHEKTSSVDEKDYPCKCRGWCAKDFLPNARHQRNPSETEALYRQESRQALGKIFDRRQDGKTGMGAGDKSFGR